MESNKWVFTSQITPEFLLQKNQALEKVLKLLSIARERTYIARKYRFAMKERLFLSSRITKNI